MRYWVWYVLIPLGWFALSFPAAALTGRLLSGRPSQPAVTTRRLNASARREYIRALGDPGNERVDCGCRHFDNEADRSEWTPCPEHLEQLIGDARQ